jgi:hypothetical protein
MTYTTVADVTRVFNELFEGTFVQRVDERNATDSQGQAFKMFYIHFLPGTSVEMEVFKQKLEKDGVVQVMTGRGKWFWKVYLNKSTKVATEKPVRKGPRIMTEDDEKLFLQWKESRNRAAASETVQGFTQEEVDELDEAINAETLTEAEMDELESEHAAAATHAEQEELQTLADELAKA